MTSLRKLQVDSIHLWTKCMQEKKKKRNFQLILLFYCTLFRILLRKVNLLILNRILNSINKVLFLREDSLS